MASADAGFRRLRVFCIKLLLLLGSPPERDEVVVLFFFVLPHFENDGVQLLPHPADCPVLFRQIRTLVKVVRVRENFPHLFESHAFSGLLLTARSSAHRSETS
jgi:hypothetical protein